MASYHVEFRIQGYAKRYAKQLIYSVSREFRVRGVTRRRVVPHISLYGPFTTSHQRQVVHEVVRVCSAYKVVPFTFKGFNFFNNSRNKVIYLDVEPSEALRNLRLDLARALLPITSTKSKEDQSGKGSFKFHATIAFKDIDAKFERIWGYISQKEKPEISQHLLRVTIIKNGKILYEYDLIQHKLLNRRQALNKSIFMETIRRLRMSHIESEDEIRGTEEDISEEELEENEGDLWGKIKSIFEGWR